MYTISEEDSERLITKLAILLSAVAIIGVSTVIFIGKYLL